MHIEVKREMDLEIDTEHNVGYLLLDKERPIKRQTVLNRMGLVVDWDGDGGIVGIEFLAARAQLGPVWDEMLGKET